MVRRTSRYWLWFGLFGIAFSWLTYHEHQTLNGESLWLLTCGALGLAADARWIAQGRYRRTYELLLGLFFGGIGALGVLAGVGINPLVHWGTLADLPSHVATMGLGTGVYPSIMHMIIGLTAVSHSLRVDY